MAGIDRCAGLADAPEHREVRRPEVSGWSVREHVEHLLLADRGIVSWIEGVLDGEVEAPTTGRPTLAGRLVLLSGFIPRGRGRAPEPTVPGDMSAEALRSELSALERGVTALEGRLDEIDGSRARYPHPVLGSLTPAQWLRFLAVHHWHHEKMIDEILSRA